MEDHLKLFVTLPRKTTFLSEGKVLHFLKFSPEFFILKVLSLLCTCKPVIMIKQLLAFCVTVPTPTPSSTPPPTPRGKQERLKSWYTRFLLCDFTVIYAVYVNRLYFFACVPISPRGGVLLHLCLSDGTCSWEGNTCPSLFLVNFLSVVFFPVLYFFSIVGGKLCSRPFFGKANSWESLFTSSAEIFLQTWY